MEISARKSNLGRLAEEINDGHQGFFGREQLEHCA